MGASNGGEGAPLPRALDTDLFDLLTARIGATSDQQRARALEVHRSTIYRMRQRRHAPSMATASRLARLLGTTIDELFPVQVGDAA